MKTLLLLLLCGTASAQVWDYTGSTMAGSMLTQDIGGQVASDISGYFTAQVVLQGNNIVSYSALFNESNGQSIALYYPNSGGYGNTVTQVGNGFAFAFDFANYNAYWMTVNLGTGTDTFSYTNDHGPYGGTCEANPGAPMLCSVNATGTSGTWQTAALAAPEIDPKGGMAAFLLLAGGLAVIRGRER